MKTHTFLNGRLTVFLVVAIFSWVTPFTWMADLLIVSALVLVVAAEFVWDNRKRTAA